MAELYICGALRDNTIDLRICKGCRHSFPHVKDEECEYSVCDKQNFVCECIPIQKEWD
jgi:hypothetical protein